MAVQTDAGTKRRGVLWGRRYSWGAAVGNTWFVVENQGENHARARGGHSGKKKKNRPEKVQRSTTQLTGDCWEQGGRKSLLHLALRQTVNQTRSPEANSTKTKLEHWDLEADTLGCISCASLSPSLGENRVPLLRDALLPNLLPSFCLLINIILKFQKL